MSKSYCCDRCRFCISWWISGRWEYECQVSGDQVVANYYCNKFEYDPESDQHESDAEIEQKVRH